MYVIERHTYELKLFHNQLECLVVTLKSLQMVLSIQSNGTADIERRLYRHSIIKACE